jgi:hypothetical protein
MSHKAVDRAMALGRLILAMYPRPAPQVRYGRVPIELNTVDPPELIAAHPKQISGHFIQEKH